MGRGANETAALPTRSATAEFTRHFQHPLTQSFWVRGEKKADRERVLAELVAAARRTGYVVGEIHASKLDPREDEFAVKALLNEIQRSAAQVRRQMSDQNAAWAMIRHLDTVLYPQRALQADVNRLWVEHKLIPAEMDHDKLEQALTLLALLAAQAQTKALLFIHEVQAFGPGKAGYKQVLPSLLMAYAHVLRKHPQVALVVSGPASASARALGSYPDAEMMFSGVTIGG